MTHAVLGSMSPFALLLACSRLQEIQLGYFDFIVFSQFIWISATQGI